MGMNVGQKGGSEDEPEVMIDINTTPLIDVMLVLLIMLIITIPIQTHAVKMDMPNPNATPPLQLEPPPVYSLEIDFDGTVIWDGTVIPDHKALEHRLIAASRLAVEPEFHIRPNKLVEYKHVIKVLAAARRHGITKIGLVGNEQFL